MLGFRITVPVWREGGREGGEEEGGRGEGGREGGSEEGREEREEQQPYQAATTVILKDNTCNQLLRQLTQAEILHMHVNSQHCH